MAETNWGDEGTNEPKKRRIPTWLWFCGGGCLLMVIVAIVVGGLLFSKVKSAADPEKQWPELAQILAYDERPADLELNFGWSLGMNMYFLTDHRGYMHVLMQLPPKDKEKTRRQMTDPEFTGGIAGLGGRKDPQGGTIKVQGREMKVLRFYQMERGAEDGAEAPTPGMPKPRAGVSIVIDLTREDDDRPLIWQMTRTDRKSDAITDEEVIEVLKPFHVGTDR